MDNLFEYGDILKTPFEAFPGSWSRIKPHWHYYTEVIYVSKGQMITETQNETYISNPGDIIIINPRVVHAYTSEPNDDNKFLCYCIKFDGNLLRNTIPGTPIIANILEAASKSEDISIAITKEQLGRISMERYFKSCVKEVKNKKYGYDVNVNAFLSLILTEIIRVWQTQGFDPAAYVCADKFSKKTILITEYIDKHSSEQINIKQLAEKCGMCYSNFAKQFKAQYGKTCKEYIEFIRICKADTMLLYSDSTLDFISQETGFNDASHFIRTYKKIRGVTPRQRRLTKNKY